MRGMERQATGGLELGSQTETHIIFPLWRRNNNFLVLCIVIFSLCVFFSIFISKTKHCEQNLKSLASYVPMSRFLVLHVYLCYYHSYASFHF